MQQHRTAPRTMTRVTLRVMAAAASTCLVLLAAPGWAHVTVDPESAAQGSYTALAFRVPNETDSTATTKVQVFLPADHPLASVSVKPHPGWHVRIETAKLAEPLSTDDGEVTEAVARITWSADGAGAALQPGEYDEFDVSAGPLPEVSSLTFKVLQTYSDDTVVRWIDPPAAAGQPEPEHPAPTLTLVPASAETTAESGSGDGTATAALVVSLAAVLLAGTALGTSLLRRRAGGSRSSGP
jgi:uncharacterized protein YcnI